MLHVILRLDFFLGIPEPPKLTRLLGDSLSSPSHVLKLQKDCPVCLEFIYVLGIQTLVLGFTQWALHLLSHLSSLEILSPFSKWVSKIDSILWITMRNYGWFQVRLESDSVASLWNACCSQSSCCPHSTGVGDAKKNAIYDLCSICDMNLRVCGTHILGFRLWWYNTTLLPPTPQAFLSSH